MATLLRTLPQLQRAERKLTAATAKLRRVKMQITRTTAAERRADTRRKIQLGGLLAKAQVPALAGNDPAVILGALLDVASRLRLDRDGQVTARWRQAGIAALGQQEG